jgi:hypothetical protein
MAAVSAVNLTINKGTYFEETFTLTAEDERGLNLSGSSVTARMKKHPTASTSYPFSTTLTIANSSVKISMASTITATLPSGRCCYDILLVASSGFISKVVEGNVIVQETVSV